MTIIIIIEGDSAAAMSDFYLRARAAGAALIAAAAPPPQASLSDGLLKAQIDKFAAAMRELQEAAEEEEAARKSLSRQQCARGFSPPRAFSRRMSLALPPRRNFAYRRQAR